LRFDFRSQGREKKKEGRDARASNGSKDAGESGRRKEEKRNSLIPATHRGPLHLTGLGQGGEKGEEGGKRKQRKGSSPAREEGGKRGKKGSAAISQGGLSQERLHFPGKAPGRDGNINQYSEGS